MKDFFSEKNISIIMDHIRDGVQVIDAEGKLVFCNREAAMLDDISIENSLGKHITEIYPSLNEDNSTLLKVLKMGMPILDYEQAFTTYKGKTVTTLNTTLPIRQEGRVIGAMEISHNITDVRVLTERVVDLQNKVYGGKQAVVENSAKYRFEEIITHDPQMQQAKVTASKVANADIPVVVWGDTGTGKELFVHAIHNASKRKDKPFIAQNCAALPATLLEGILFGTVKGSYTGATDRVGLFETADGGTLFLDEINSMPLELQGKLLRALQDGTFRRVGDVQTRRVNVRIIAATNVEPSEAVERGLLRRDLYYRLNTVTLYLPPLKDRFEDLSLLTAYFIRKYNEKLYLNVKAVSDDVMRVFQSYNWPGNVRELEHVIEGAMSLMDGNEITLEDLPSNLKRFYEQQAVNKNNERLELEGKAEGVTRLTEESGFVSLKAATQNLEKAYIQRALSETGGNITKTAELLELPRQTLQYKLKQYGL